MKFLNLYEFKLFLISTLIVTIKYFVSYYFYPDEDLFFKIFRLADADFNTYSLIVESISRIDFKTDWSLNQLSEKIIGFPFFSLIWHSIFFHFFDYYSFIILEIFFYFILILLFFKIFYLIQKDLLISFISVIILISSLEILSLIINFTNLNFYVVLRPLAEFYGQRFPHPLVTSVYFFTIFLISIKLFQSSNLKLNKKYFIYTGLMSILLINSFFFHFIKSTIFLILLAIHKYKKNLINVIKINYISFLQLFCLILVGFCILFAHLYIAENDYSARLGTYKIYFDDKLIILKVLLKKLIQPEIIVLLSLSIICRLNYRKFGIINQDKMNYDLFLIFFVACIISPFVFVILTHTSIYLYYFWSAVKFSGFLYLFLIFIRVFFIKRIKSKLTILSSFFVIFLIFSNLCNNYYKQLNNDYEVDRNRHEIKDFLFDKKYYNTDKILLSNDYPIMHLWLNFNNKYLINTDGFVSSYSDEILENLKINYLKLLNLNLDSFIKILNENEDNINKRNNFAKSFGYKYSVNLIRHEKPIEEEYSKKLSKRILSISPLVQWHQFFSNKEKKRLINKYKNFVIDKNSIPDLFIMRKDDIFISNFQNLKILNYVQIFENQNFIILRKS